MRGGPVIDEFGDTIMNCKHLPGDTWRARHDTGKLAIVRECINAGLVHDCEVYGLFSDLIPAQALNRMERGRKRQAIVPDFRMEMPRPTGGTSHQLAELKIVSCYKSW